LKLDPRHVATLVAYLCSARAQHVSGQIFGVRGREIFLFDQPRPRARLVEEAADWTVDGLARAVDDRLADGFTDLTTDLEAFNTEPYV
jgi:hypothetical protein